MTIEKAMNWEEGLSNKQKYLDSLLVTTSGMSLESHPIEWSAINKCDCDDNNDKTVTKNKGPKI